MGSKAFGAISGAATVAQAFTSKVATPYKANKVLEGVANMLPGPLAQSASIGINIGTTIAQSKIAGKQVDEHIGGFLNNFGFGKAMSRLMGD